MLYLFYKVQFKDLYMIKFILEAYENLMVVSTVDQQQCKIQITLAPDFQKECEEILADMGKRFPMIQVFDDPSKSQGNY